MIYERYGNDLDYKEVTETCNKTEDEIITICDRILSNYSKCQILSQENKNLYPIYKKQK